MPGPGFFWMGEEEEREVIDLIRTRHLFRYGDEKDPDFRHTVKSLENEVARAFNVRHALGVSSGTAALITAMSAAGIGPGDEVIVPGYTFIASISSVIACNAVPVLAEVDDSLTLDPDDVERKITPYTKAILAVHMLGNPCDLDRLLAIAEKHELLLIEDAAQAFGGSYKGRRLGAIGSIGIYSFNVFKVINAGDGGMVVTDDDALYNRAFAYHDQGHLPSRMGIEIGNRTIIGQNFRLTELGAAVLLAQFRKLDQVIEALKKLKDQFKSALQGAEGLSFRKINDADGECHTILTVFLPTPEAAERLVQKVGTTTVAQSGWHVYSNMEHILGMKTANPRNNPVKNQYYKGNVQYHKGMLPNTDALLRRAINISIGVVDRGLGAGFGINPLSTPEEVERTAERFLTELKSAL